ncbi:MAG: YihY/virulence factor BrkB family protein [Sphingomonas sp.]|nr:YihY/virulence factor BrkB family protein [Sphingomonas sp.]
MDAATRRTTDPQPDNRGHQADSPWQLPLSGWKDVAVRTWHQSSKDNVSIVAAGVAFYGFLAMVPMLAAIILTYGLVADPQTVVRHAGDLTNVLPQSVAGLVGDQMLNVVETSEGKKGLGLAAAIAIAFWGARNAATSIITALNIAYEEEEKRSFVRVTLLALAMTLGAVVMALFAGAAIALMAALEAMLPGLGGAGVVIGKALTYLLLGAIAAGAAATMFRYAPSRDKAEWSWLTPGTLFFAGFWIVLTLAFGFYVSQFGSYGATYGSLSAVVVLLTWLYLSSYVLLLGAELNSELEHQRAKDTTSGQDRPMGERGAWAADTVAGSGGKGDPEPQLARSVHPNTGSQPAQHPLESASPDQEAGGQGHPYIASRVTARAAQAGGLAKVGMISSVLATVGLAKLRRRGSQATGAALLLLAAGLSLSRRED